MGQLSPRHGPAVHQVGANHIRPQTLWRWVGALPVGRVRSGRVPRPAGERRQERVRIGVIPELARGSVEVGRCRTGRSRTAPTPRRSRPLRPGAATDTEARTTGSTPAGFSDPSLRFGMTPRGGGQGCHPSAASAQAGCHDQRGNVARNEYASGSSPSLRRDLWRWVGVVRAVRERPLHPVGRVRSGRVPRPIPRPGRREVHPRGSQIPRFASG